MRGRETITVKPQVKVDRLRSSATPPPEPYDIEGCLTWPRASQEEGKGWVGIEGLNVKCPPGSDVPRTARVVVGGEEYEVEGEPQDFGRKGVIVVLAKISGVS